MSDTAASTHSAVCMFAMKGSSCAEVRPLASPEKILKSTGCGTAAVITAITKAIDMHGAGVLEHHSRARGDAAPVGRNGPIIAAVFGLLNMPEPMPTTASQNAPIQ